MDTIAATLLMHCEDGWKTLTEIEEGISVDLELLPDTPLKQILEPLLLQFKTLGLLESDPG
jgi:hypothetical protein